VAGCLLAALAVLFVVGTRPAAAECPNAPTPVAENTFWKNADRTNDFPLCPLEITSATSDGLSLFAMDPRAGRVVQLQFAAGDTFNRIDPPSPVSAAGPDDRVDAMLLLGPRAFYAVATVPGQVEPTLFRADRVPTAMRGGWKPLRHIAGRADLGLAAVAMNQTIWMLRSDSAAGFNVDWQPVATENNEVLAPPGPTIKLGNPAGNREAAGVTATKDAIYAFGGLTQPLDAVRIPLVNGAPTAPVPLGRLPQARQGATALVHATTVYLVGGNAPGTPTIIRAQIARDGSLGPWERYPEPPPGAEIRTAVFARDHLWIFRSDGSIQKSRVGDAAFGRARVVWNADTRPRFVQPGEQVPIDVNWTYEGPRDLTGISASVTGSFVDPRARRPVPIVRLDPVSFGGVTLSAPTTVGTPLRLIATIPTDKKRSEYMGMVQLHYTETTVDASGQLRTTVRSLGPLLRFRFLVKRTF
jgi:hypothetical protein